jgi:hypothetical protein
MSKSQNRGTRNMKGNMTPQKGNNHTTKDLNDNAGMKSQSLSSKE